MNEKVFSRSLMNIILVICLFMVALLPTSSNGELFKLNHEIFVWSVSVIVVIVVGLINKVKYRNMIIFFAFLLSYMMIITLVAQKNFNNYHISLARIAPMIVLVYISFIEINYIPKISFMEKLLHFFCILCIIWNLGIIFNSDKITNFTLNNYNQYYDMATVYSITLSHKPVMSFGVHTYASYFYFIFFILSYYTYEKLHKPVFLFYSIMLTIFCLFLVSTTAIIFFIYMVLFIMYKLFKKYNVKRILALLLLIVLLTFIIGHNFSDLYDKLYKNITGGNNSFISRYSRDSIFTENFKVISSSMGIGFNIIDDLDLSYTDSGYIVYLTMGSIPLLIMIYYRIYKFLCTNVNSEYRKIFMLAVFLFEFALPASINYRFGFIMIFAICYLNALTAKTKELEESKDN